ncbi:MAG: recombination protein RecO [Sulfuricurvum sp.]
MQGFIVGLNRVRDEDLIVRIISRDKLLTLYRFYGARHSTINIGYKIDFQDELGVNSSIARLKDVIHLGYKWLDNTLLLKPWQDFTLLLGRHLRDSYELDSFYFDLLEFSSSIWHKQNHKRVAIEAYIKLLEHEGRLHSEQICFLCSRGIEDHIALLRGFLPACKECSKRSTISIDGFLDLVHNHSTLYLSDKEVEALYITLQEGF